MSDDRPPYQYSSIDASNEIRLFTFEETESPEDISIRIQHVPIDALPPYIAISYTWGDLKHTKSILCDGKQKYITTNLWHALKRLRPMTPAKVPYWADQICINQSNEDNQEKNKQVALMSTIFPSATRVLCWLGEEDEHTDRAFEILRLWAGAMLDEGLRTQLGRILSSDVGENATNQTTQRTALVSITSRPWFRRAWTLQEIFVSFTQPPLILCGSCQMDWRTLCVGFTALSSTLGSPDAVRAFGENITFAIAMFEVYTARIRETLSFSRLILPALRREATDPRDRIFAMLGIMRHGGFKYPDPDYNLSPKQVFSLYTRAIIEQDQALDVLAVARRVEVPRDTPHWVASPETVDLFAKELISRAKKEPYVNGGVTGRTTPMLVTPASSFDEELHIYGLKVDVIAHVYNVKDLVRTIDGGKGRWRDLLNAVQVSTQSLNLPSIYERTGESFSMACMKTLVSNDFYVACYHAEKTYLREALALHNRFLRQKKKATTDESQTNTGAEAWTGDALYELAKQNLRFELPIEGDNKPSTPETQQPVVDPEILARVDALVTTDLVREISDRIQTAKLAVTSTGLLALVPKTANISDEICLLMGGVLPLLMRPCQEEGSYRLVGEAYVHGLMDGKSAKECEAICERAKNGPDNSELYKFVLR